MDKGFLLGVMKTFWNWTRLMVALSGEYIKNHHSTEFKRVSSAVCELYLNEKLSLQLSMVCGIH